MNVWQHSKKQLRPKTVAVFASGDITGACFDFDYIVGVDRACLYLLDKGLPLDLAVGDFDSVSTSEKALIVKKAQRICQAQPEKNDTDTELALKEVFRQYPEARVTVFGAFGGRLDHALSNLFMPSDPELSPFMRQFFLRDQQNHISYYPKGSHLIMPEPQLPYVAFMTSGEGALEILGAKYPLASSNYFKKKIYTSNEFLDDPIKVTVEDDYVVVIRSRDRR